MENQVPIEPMKKVTKGSKNHMSIRVLFFGKLADTAHSELGTTSIDVDETQLPNSDSFNTVAELAQYLSELSPRLAEAINQVGNLYAVNQNLCKEDTKINAGDEIAFMSPLSGG